MRAAVQEVDLPFGADQADALRRRRLSDHVAAVPYSVQYAGRALRPGGRLPQRRGAGTGRRHPRSSRSTRPIRGCGSTASSPTSAAPAAEALICLVGVQSNQFPRAVDLARQFIKAGLPVAMGGFHAAGCLSMLPVVPPEIQAAMDMGISIFAGEAEEGRLDIVLKRRLERHAEAALQLHGRPAEHRGRPDAAACRRRRWRATRAQVELRPWPRLPVPVLVLHHHQRAGPQEPLPHRRRSRSDRARELQAGHHVVLHHRRQHGPQQALGGLLRPADRAQGERGHRSVPDHPGRHAVPSHPELHP